MSPIIASQVGGVNPSCLQNRDQSRQDTPFEPAAERRPVVAGCAAAPRFIQVHPRLLTLHPLDLATYVLLCERTITGQYPAGVPLSGADLARFFEADASAAAGTRYNRALKRLVEAGLVLREPRPGRKACYSPLWPGTQRRKPSPLSAPYPHRLFVPIYLRLYEQFVGTFHPTDTGPARIERFVEAPSLDPVALHAWATARWATWRNEAVPSIEPEVVERLRAIGLWDDTGVYDPEHPRKPTSTRAKPIQPAAPATDRMPPVPANAPGDNSAARAAAWTMLDLMAQQMRLMQQQIAAMQQILLGESLSPITPAAHDQVPISPSESHKVVGAVETDSSNTDSNSNTEIANTDQTLEHLHHQRPHHRTRRGGGGNQMGMSPQTETEAERLLRQEGVIASNARRFARRRPEQVLAAINFAKKSRRRFEDPAGMIVWLLDKNEFADAHERTGANMADDEVQARCWYCGKPGCTTCAAEQQHRLLVRWQGAEFDADALWHDLRIAAREACPGLPVDAAEAKAGRRGRLILMADEEPAMMLRAARHCMIELAARRLGVTIDVVITRRPPDVVERPLPLPDLALPRASLLQPHSAPSGQGSSDVGRGALPMNVHAGEVEAQAPPCAEALGVSAPTTITSPGEANRDGAGPVMVSHEDGAALAVPDAALEAAASGLPELVRALFRGARVEADPVASDIASFYLHAGSPMAAERLRKQPALAERIVGAAVGRPVRVTIRSPDRSRVPARPSFWR